MGRRPDDTTSVCGILDHLARRAGASDRVTVGDLLDALGARTYGPALLVPALIGMSPISGIPVVPTILAGLIILFAVQMLFGREHMWLPGFARHRHLPEERLVASIEKIRPIAKRLDRWFHGRLLILTGGLFVRIAAAACIGLALMVPPLELLPFAAGAPMAAIALFGIALTVRDGLLMALAMSGTVAVAAFALWSAF